MFVVSLRNILRPQSGNDESKIPPQFLSKLDYKGAKNKRDKNKEDEGGAEEGMLGKLGAKVLLLAVLAGLFGGKIPADIKQVSGGQRQATTQVVKNGQKYEITIKSV